MLNKHEHIRKFVKSRVGAPIVDLCDPEASAIDEAFEMASVEYWIAMPHVKKQLHNLSTSNGELHLDIPSYLEAHIPELVRDEAYFVGIVRENMVTSLSPNTSYAQQFDRYLLGNNVNSNNNYLTQDPRYEADRIQYLNSTEDQYFGETDISIDQVSNKVIVTYPPIHGQLHLWWAYGFSPEKTVEFLPMNHLKVFRKMVALEFIEIILASRTPVQLSGDFTIDVSDLQSKRDVLREELAKEIPETSVFVAQWG